MALMFPLLLSCGLDEKRLSVAGTVDISGTADSSGPVFVALAKGNDLETVLKDPLNSIKEIVPVDRTTLNFSIDLGDSALNPGDEIFIIAFIDNNYTSGVPYPGPGDYIGLYMDSRTLRPTLTLLHGSNAGITINVCREVYSFDAKVSGTIEGSDTGRVTVIAYAGEITSLNIASLNYDAIIGFQELTKGPAPVTFSFPILPYGFAPPVQNVYLIAFIDTNGNGIPDGGDRMGFYSGEPNGLPSMTTLNEGDNPGYSITMSTSLPVPSGSPVSIKGFFQRPSGYGSSSPPAFLIISDAGDPNLLFTDPLSAIKSFYRLPPGGYAFDIDLSGTGLAPGSGVMIMALWDRDYTAGFPDPTPDDRVGFFQNNSALANSIILAEGENLIEPFGDWAFNLNHIVYEHNASIGFQFDNGGLPAEYRLKTGDQVIALAVHKDGYSSFSISDMDYIVAMKTIIIDDPARWYSAPVFPAICESIAVSDPFAINDLYMFTVLDSNKNGRPDAGEYIGFYWDWIIIYIPKTFTAADGLTTLDKKVRFTTNTF